MPRILAAVALLLALPVHAEVNIDWVTVGDPGNPADVTGFGAMADSPTKSGTTRAQPTDLRACAKAFPELPIYPIGGLHMENLQLASVVDLRRAALGSALLDADNPEAVARAAIAWSLES